MEIPFCPPELIHRRHLQALLYGRVVTMTTPTLSDNRPPIVPVRVTMSTSFRPHMSTRVGSVVSPMSSPSAQESWKYFPTWPSYDVGQNHASYRESHSTMTQYGHYYGKYSREQFYEAPYLVKQTHDSSATYPKTSTPVPQHTGIWSQKRSNFAMSTPKQPCSTKFPQSAPPQEPYSMPMSPASVDSSSVDGSYHNSSSGFFSEDSSLESYSPAPSPSCFDSSISDMVASPVSAKLEQEPMAPPIPPRPGRAAKPPATYIAMISSAILSTPDRRMILADIYDYILDHYPFYRSAEPTWRNAIRHNLSVNECFIKNGRSETGRGYFWSIHPACIQAFLEGDFRRREARRRCQIVNKTCQQMARELAMVAPPCGYGSHHSYLPQNFPLVQPAQHTTNIMHQHNQTMYPCSTTTVVHIPPQPDARDIFVDETVPARESPNTAPDDISILQEAAAMAELYDHVGFKQSFHE